MAVMTQFAVPVPGTAAEPNTRKKLNRRRTADHSQRWRRAVQLAFLLLNVWIGAKFYLFVRYYETGGQSVWAPRPAGVEGWLPVAGLMNLKLWLLTGRLPDIHPAGMFLLLAFVAISVVFRKAFCGWLCPVGTMSEMLWRLGRQTFRRNFLPPRWADLSLRGVKYVLLGLFAYAVASMSADGIAAFLGGPYGIIADVKMLNFFRTLGFTGGAVLAGLVLASVFVQNFWCRYLCPYGGLLGLAALLSPLRIRREEQNCIDCAKCAKACPAALPVDKIVTIRSAECMACLECVAACPAEGALRMSVADSRNIPGWAIAAGMAILFFSIVGYAKWSGSWNTDVPSRVYQELIPHAQEFSHP
jgi:polyferredoxin